MGVLKDFFNLVKGMTITGKHLGRHAITIQYPEQKMQMFERSRGVVVLLSDKETGELNCTMCMLCMRACPTAAIQIDAPRDENKKRQLKSFVVDNTLCCYCGLCEEACNFSAIKLAPKYEFSTWNKEELVWDTRKLQDMGRDVPYEDTRKKKPAAEKTTEKPAPKAPAEPKPAAAAANPGPHGTPADTPAPKHDSDPAHDSTPSDDDKKGDA